MSTATIAKPGASASTDGHPLSPVDYVKSLSPEEKTYVFESLVREMIDMNEDRDVIPLETLNGAWLGNLVLRDHPGAAADRFYSSLDPQTRRAIVLSHVNLDLDLSSAPTEEEFAKIVDETYAAMDAKTCQAFVQPYLDLEISPGVLKTMAQHLPSDFNPDASFTVDEFLARFNSEAPRKSE